MRTNQPAGVAKMVAAMTLSGTIGVLVTEVDLAPHQIVFFRCLFGAATLGLYCWAMGLFDKAVLAPRTLALVVGGGVCIVADWVVLFAAFTHLGIGLSTIILHLQPFFVVLITAAAARERVPFDTLAWIGFAFAGLVMATGEVSVIGGSAVAGVLLALMAALLYAGATVCSRAVKGVAPEVTALVHVALGTVALAPFAGLAGVGGLPAGDWGLLATLGVVHTGLMYALLYGAYQKLTTAAVAVLAFVYPAVAIAVDFLAYGRVLSPVQVAGLLAILLAGTAVNRGWRFGRRRVAA
ncbi:MAG TPA: DMT family transporter [Azospirillaceae bacterium]|nr:DMT family transporter [Azospirillaceae bacterium]